MGLRKLGEKEALEAAQICGYDDEHGLKGAYAYGSVSNYDVFVDTDDRHIVIADKNGSNAAKTDYTLPS